MHHDRYSTSKYLKYNTHRKVAKLILRGTFILLAGGLIIWFAIYFFIIQAKNLSFVRLLTSALLNLDVKPATLSGITNSGMKYYFTSEKLNNYISNFLLNEQLQFDEPIMILQMPNGHKVTLEGKLGVLSEDKKQLHITQGVNLTSTDGYKLYVNDIIIDLSSNKIYSDDNLNADYEHFTVVSQGFEITDNLNVLNLKGSVKVTEKN